MNYGPLLFLGAFFALAASWFGFVLTPQIQVGQLQQTNAVPAGPTYPVSRPGLAREGLQVYRANGCAWCHSQQLGQTGTVCDVMLNDAGTNQPALIEALGRVNPNLSEGKVKELLSGLPKSVVEGVTLDAATAAVKTLNASGAKSAVWLVAVGPDMSRGWGKRRTVAEDFLFDSPVMLGSMRIGPDLADVGARQPDENWHLLHLYSPTLEVKGSIMPAYRYLFEKRRIERTRSSDTLVLPPALAPPAGYEIVPGTAAKALAAYMVSLRADVPIFPAPFSSAFAPTAAATTNAPAGANMATTNVASPNTMSTNAAPTNAPSK